MTDFLKMTKGDVIFAIIENVTLNNVPDPEGNVIAGMVFTVTYEGLDLKYASGIVQYSQAIVTVVTKELEGVTEVILPTHESALYVRKGNANHERLTEGTMASIEGIIKQQVRNPLTGEEANEVIICKRPQQIDPVR